MEKLELIAGEIFGDEYKAFNKSEHQNDSQVAKAIAQMMNFIEKIVLENAEKYIQKLMPMELEEFGNVSETCSKTHKQFEEKFSPIPNYFVPFRDRIMSYYECYEVVGYEQRDRFSLFLAFNFRNASRHNIQPSLDLLNKQHAQFTDFLKIHLDEYGFLYPPVNFKLVKKWLKKTTAESKNEDEVSEIPLPPEPEPTTDAFQETELSGRTLTLGLYFFMKHYGVDIREKNRTSNAVKFLHFISNTEFTTLQNSNFYQLVKKAPSIGIPENSIALLSEIKERFIQLKLNYIAEEVEQEIEKERNAKTEKK